MAIGSELTTLHFFSLKIITRIQFMLRGQVDNPTPACPNGAPSNRCNVTKREKKINAAAPHLPAGPHCFLLPPTRGHSCILVIPHSHKRSSDFRVQLSEAFGQPLDLVVPSKCFGLE